MPTDTTMTEFRRFWDVLPPDAAHDPRHSQRWARVADAITTDGNTQALLDAAVASGAHFPPPPILLTAEQIAESFEGPVVLPDPVTAADVEAWFQGREPIPAWVAWVLLYQALDRADEDEDMNLP